MGKTRLHVLSDGLHLFRVLDHFEDGVGKEAFMGTMWYVRCLDCKEYMDLDKFYSFVAYRQDWCGYASIDKENLDDYKNDGFIYRSLRLHFFIDQHRGHRIAVENKHEAEDWLDVAGDQQEYRQVFPWPAPGNEAQDVIDFTDPKAGRLIIKTRFGDIFMDHRNDGVNCFRFVDGERIDTLLLPKQERTEWDYLTKA